MRITALKKNSDWQSPLKMKNENEKMDKRLCGRLSIFCLYVSAFLRDQQNYFFFP